MSMKSVEWQVAFGKDGASIYQESSGTIAKIPDDLVDWKANARLVVAAPELLEDLKYWVRHIENCGASSGELQSLKAWLSKARDTIKKAEGK